MKFKIIVIFVAILGAFGLAGCKPKPTTLTGQVFIVTQGGNNFKLGDVEILLIEKSQIMDFLQKKNPIIDLEIVLRQQELELANSNVLAAQADYDSFKQNEPDRNKGCDLFLGNKFFENYPHIDKIKLQIKALRQQAAVLSKQSDVVSARIDQADKQGDYLTSLNLLTQNSYSAQALDLYAKVDSKIDEMWDYVKRVESEKEKNLQVATTRKIYSAAVLNGSPTVEEYLIDFSPIVVQKTISDADGKFFFSYLRDKPLAIYATARRAVLNKTEKYCWLVDAPTNAESVQVFLSNNNLVYNDPDGYFQLKPKEAQ